MVSIAQLPYQQGGPGLGLGHNNDVSLPTPIPNLPKISKISCGGNFTVCVDYEGFIWPFGENKQGQLGTGNKTNFNVPQKLINIPPVLSVACGYGHTLMITNDSNLGHVGRIISDNYGDTKDRLILQKTSFLNISKISAGNIHSLFQNDKGEILHAVIIIGDHVDWVILILLKSHQVSFSIYL